jgi:hypothetical protein
MAGCLVTVPDANPRVSCVRGNPVTITANRAEVREPLGEPDGLAGRAGPPGADPDGPSVADVVRDVVAVSAPGELPLVEGLRLLGEAAAVRRLTRRSRPREPLGFGFGEVVPLVTSVVWIAVDEAVRRGVDGTATGLRAWLRRVFRRRRTTDPAVPPLDRAQLAEVARRVRELAGQTGLASDQADVLADRVVARLALGGPAGPASRQDPGTGAERGQTGPREREATEQAAE